MPVVGLERSYLGSDCLPRRVSARHSAIDQLTYFVAREAQEPFEDLSAMLSEAGGRSAIRPGVRESLQGIPAIGYVLT